MRIATVQRASLIVGAGAADIHEANGGRFGPGAAGLYERWAGFVDWAAATLPQFSLGKSRPRFGPVGPWLVTVDDFDDPDGLELGCAINGEQMQKGRTRDLIFGVADLVEQLSRATPLLRGDLVSHRHAAGRRAGPYPAALACPWRRADQLHRGHRRDAPPFRRRPAPLRRTP